MFKCTKKLSTRVVIVTVALILASSVAFASNVGLGAHAVASSDVKDHVTPILPYRGMYYSPGHGGTGMTVDVDANGYVFAVFYTYTKSGKPYYYLMEGLFKPSAPQVVVDTGVLGTMDAPAYISENGECVGKGCTYRSPDRSDAHLSAQLVWTAPRRLHLTLGDQSWDIQGGQYTISDADMLEGTWATVATINYGGSYLSPPQPLAKVSRSTKTTADFPTLSFASNVVIYDVIVLDYQGLPQPVSTHSFIGYDPKKGVVVSFAVNSDYAGGFTKPVVTGTAFVTGPNTVREYFTDKGKVIGEAVRSRLRAGDTAL